MCMPYALAFLVAACSRLTSFFTSERAMNEPWVVFVVFGWCSAVHIMLEDWCEEKCGLPPFQIHQRGRCDQEPHAEAYPTHCGWQ